MNSGECYFHGNKVSSLNFGFGARDVFTYIKTDGQCPLDINF